MIQISVQNSNWPKEPAAIVTKGNDSSITLKTGDWRRRCALCWKFTERVVLFTIMCACCHIKKAEVIILIRAAHDTLTQHSSLAGDWRRFWRKRGTEEQSDRARGLDENKSCPGFYSWVPVLMICIVHFHHKPYQHKTYCCVTGGKVQSLMRFFFQSWYCSLAWFTGATWT